MSGQISATKAAKGKGAKGSKGAGKTKTAKAPKSLKANGKTKIRTKAKAAETPAREAPAPAPAPAANGAASAAYAMSDVAAMTSEQRAVVEKLSANLARAALTAQGAIAEMALRQADRPAALSPDPFHVGPALTEVMGRLAAQPDRLMRAQADLFSQYLELWQATARRMGGETPDPVATPARGDKRFADPEWAENPVFDVIKQSYLLTSNWMNGLVAEVSDVDPMNKRRVEFFMKMLTDAFSPSNFLASNPAALREVMATGGENVTVCQPLALSLVKVAVANSLPALDHKLPVCVPVLPAAL